MKPNEIWIQQFGDRWVNSARRVYGSTKQLKETDIHYLLAEEVEKQRGSDIAKYANVELMDDYQAIQEEQKADRQLIQALVTGIKTLQFHSCNCCPYTDKHSCDICVGDKDARELIARASKYLEKEEKE